MEYSPKEIEARWQKYWVDNKTFKIDEPGDKKLYVLDMFPYPSGSGLHMGHPLGYTGTDIFSRFRRHQGYSVLHPMGYDAFWQAIMATGLYGSEDRAHCDRTLADGTADMDTVMNVTKRMALFHLVEQFELPFRCEQRHSPELAVVK